MKTKMIENPAKMGSLLENVLGNIFLLFASISNGSVGQEEDTDSKKKP